MKKILFAANSLGLGGIETAMLSLVNYLAKQKINNEYKYDITIVLEKKEGIFLNLLDNRINLLEFTPDSNKITILRKFKNFIKQYKFKKIYKNKFDFSAAYATYSLPSCFVARIASRNSTLWCHMDYLEQYNNDYEIFKCFPNCFAFGGDLGGNHFCYNFETNEYFAIDCCTTGLEDSYCKATSLYEFIKNWEKQLEGENDYEI